MGSGNLSHPKHSQTPPSNPAFFFWSAPPAICLISKCCWDQTCDRDPVGCLQASLPISDTLRKMRKVTDSECCFYGHTVYKYTHLYHYIPMLVPSKDDDLLRCATYLQEGAPQLCSKIYLYTINPTVRQVTKKLRNLKSTQHPNFGD